LLTSFCDPTLMRNLFVTGPGPDAGGSKPGAEA
jgi:hypothetical protein